MRMTSSTSWIVIVVISRMITTSNSFGTSNLSSLLARRAFFEEAQTSLLGGGISTLIASSSSRTGDSKDLLLTPFDEISSAFTTNNLRWDDSSSSAVNWGQLRYGTSSLKEKARPAPAAPTLAQFPTWLEGDWLTYYKFEKAKFPLGRDKLTLRVPGAGLGTCLSLPNIGYNPPSPFMSRYASGAYEDMAYNIPRRFEAFWPQAKVTSVQARCPGDDISSSTMSPRCFVTGEGCTETENPQLHSSAATRFNMQFDGPTRSNGVMSQELDLTVLDQESGYRKEDETFVLQRNYVQYNVYQGSNSFFKEYMTISRQSSGIKGRIRVASFLPVDASSSTTSSYDDAQAIAVYDYTIEMRPVPSDEADLL